MQRAEVGLQTGYVENTSMAFPGYAVMAQKIYEYTLYLRDL